LLELATGPRRSSSSAPYLKFLSLSEGGGNDGEASDLGTVVGAKRR
jgi:hypothetical protein